jgi:hypothetical protein
VVKNMRFDNGDRDLIYKSYLKQMKAEEDEIELDEKDLNEENEKL